MPDRTESAAEVCRRNRWEPGDVLRTKYGRILRIEEICKSGVLIRFAIEPRRKPGWYSNREYAGWRLIGAKKIANAPLDDTPPKSEWFK